jgi:hypothetical protein
MCAVIFTNKSCTQSGANQWERMVCGSDTEKAFWWKKLWPTDMTSQSAGNVYMHFLKSLAPLNMEKRVLKTWIP